MTAGCNLVLKVWRMVNLDDDSVGGAVISGTYLGDIPARLQEEDDEQVLLQQGYETIPYFTFISPFMFLTIKERDELEVIFPKDHLYYGKRFRVVRASYSSHTQRNRNAFVKLKAVRSFESHNVQ